MSWFPCLCGHRIDDHYRVRTQRHGPCKGRDCTCKSFRPDGAAAPRA